MRRGCSHAAVASAVLALASALAVAAEPEYLQIRPLNADKSLGLLWSENVQFAPVRGQSIGFDIAVDEPADVTVELHAPEGEPIRRLADERRFERGRYTLHWDGRDQEGRVIPDEAWVPVFTAVYPDGRRTIDDPRRYSGGEIVRDLTWSVRGNKEITIDLPTPSRLLVRGGIEDGPVMRVLRRWKPVDAGRSVVRWDGYDRDQVEYFAGHDDAWFVVMAYQLPDFAVISVGNDALDYRAYRRLRGWPSPIVDIGQIALQRNGVRLERDHFMPRDFQPRVELELVQIDSVSRTGLPVVTDRALFRVDVPPEDRWLLERSFYETSFFVDYEFQAEEEQGFLPMIWEFDAGELSVGRHIATVQLFGFGGDVTSDTVAFEILR